MASNKTTIGASIDMKIEQIARICHETNRAYCETIGDSSQQPWDKAETWQRDSAVKGVTFALANPGARASAQHDAWMKDKLADGWVFGFTKDPIKKKHPCIVPYSELPLEQRLKDHLFRAVVRAFVEANGV
jgi:hypothetical protein